jgi:HSP20 family protein
MSKPYWLPALARNRGVDPFHALRKQFDDLFDAWTGNAGDLAPLTGSGVFAPRIDVSETDKELAITAELPGLEEKDVEVKLSGDQLTIKGEKRSETEDEKDEKGRYYHRIERTYGAFQRSLTLPFEAEASKVVATFKNGVLTVTLPKPADVQKASRTIEVRKVA